MTKAEQLFEAIIYKLAKLEVAGSGLYILMRRLEACLSPCMAEKI